MRSSVIRIAVGALLGLLAGGPTTQAQESALRADAARPASEAIETTLVVSPSRAPVPALRHRLLPPSTELNPGDAAPIYLRLGYGLPDGEPLATHKQVDAWLALPMDQVPLAEAEALIARWVPQIRQIEFGTRRRTCDWNYSMPEERDNPFQLRMPDAQAMRVWGRLLSLKARVEIKSGRFDAAVATLETGIAFGRHVAEGPYIINVLVGLALIGQTLDRVVELVGQHGAPNLYWALTVLPRPLVDGRAAIDNERKSVEWIMDEIEAAPRSDRNDEWTVALGRLHAQMLQLGRTTNDDLGPYRVPADLAEFRAAALPKARAALQGLFGATPDDEAIVRAIIGDYRRIADEYYRYAYLPFAETVAAPVGELPAGAKAGPAAFYALFLTNYQSVQVASARVDRKVAELRAIEALRLHAADHDGQLPATLDEVKAVPVPADPITGRAFEYRRDGAAAILGGPNPLKSRRPSSYRITVRP